MLARSGRAMTLGLDHAEVEATMAAVTSFESKQRVKRLVVDSVPCSTVNCTILQLYNILTVQYSNCTDRGGRGLQSR